MALFFPKNKFSTTQQIKDALFQIKISDYRQRPTVYHALIKELADAGVEEGEIKQALAELRNNGEISEMDKNIAAIDK